MNDRVINLGCGKTKIPGSIGMDRVNILGYVDIVHDLNKFPYPQTKNSVDEVHMYHVLEHLDKPIKVIEEIHRILKNGGKLYIRVPHFSSMGSFTDITHVRPFGYFSFDCFQEDSYHNFYTKARFKILSRKINYFGLYPNSGIYEKYIHSNQCNTLLKPFVRFINFLISSNPMLFERTWCYWVGGATEVEIVLEKQ